MSSVNKIVFDLGGVLIDWNPAYVFRQIFEGDEERMQWFFEHVCTFDWNENQDAGYPLAKATEERIALFPEFETEIKAYYGRWEEMLGGPIPETVRILEALRQKAAQRLFALTNWSHETFPIALQRYEFLHWFEDIVVSGEERTRKPHPEIYQIANQRFQLEPANTLFIDDNLRNVKAAETMGWQTIHFHSPSQLHSELNRLQIIA